MKLLLLCFISLSLYGDNNLIAKYKKEAINGNDISTYKLGLIYYNGDGVKKNLTQAFYYFNIASSYGNKKAKFNMAMLYSQKKFKDYNPKKGYKIFLELAKANHPRSQYMVGNALLKGIGVESSHKDALRWFEYSYFENNYIPSSCMIAIMYANGFGTFQNLGRANNLAKVGIEHDLKLCKYISKEFKLYKYKYDKGFKFGYYSLW